jgi:hypothetical protein
LLAEAAQLGLIAGGTERGDESDERQLRALRLLLHWKPTDRTFAGHDLLDEAYAQLEGLSHQRAEVAGRVRAARQAAGAAAGFRGAVRAQARRLEVLDVFGELAAEDRCPLCESALSNVIPDPLARVRSAVASFRAEAADVERENPRLEAYLKSQEDELAHLDTHAASVNATVEALVAQSEWLKREQDMDRARQQLIGKVRLFLETYRPYVDEKAKANLRKLRERVKQLAPSANVRETGPRLENCVGGRAREVS